MESNDRDTDVTLRPAAADDAAFLYELYAETRQAEVAMFGWDAASVEAFLRMQFDMRTRAYAMQYPQAEDHVMIVDGRPAGRMIVDRRDDAIVLIDIAVAGTFRQRGIASLLIRRLQRESAAARVPLTLHVDRSNQNAFSLYQRLGFEISGEDQIQFSMRWDGHPR
ncbi:MAG: GNAT family N-acetyltransferase [Pyrinomonadaceae bacterium]|nr:GNAT family N-acetyltransferase [Pyrinomonadaceae bacterium]